MKLFSTVMILFSIAFTNAANAQCYPSRGYYSYPSQNYYPSNYCYPSYEYHSYTYVPISTVLPLMVDPRISYQFNGFNAVVTIPATNVSLLAPATTVVQQQQQAVVSGGQQQPVINNQNQTQNQTQSLGLSKAQLDMLIDAIEERRHERNPALSPPPLVDKTSFKFKFSSTPTEIVETKFDDIVAILNVSCAKCHTGEKSSAKYPIFDGPNQLAPKFSEKLDQILSAMKDGRMPPSTCKNCIRPSESQKRQIESYVNGKRG